ncbi:MAG: hypothetical protein FJ006_02885 [Chloroflexi bacterium]|nr:hypothetical protein [Chloroflexota bacterium]
MDFFVRSLQAAIFGIINIRDPLEVGHQLRSATGGLFDGEPLVLPLPSDAPQEIPRIVLRDKEDRYSCNISSSRLDLFYRKKDPSQKWVDLRDEYLGHLSVVSRALLTNLRVDITRLGSVAEFAVPMDANPNSIIRKIFLKEGALVGEHALQLHILHRQSWETTEINRWIRLIGEEGAMLRVIVDINTLPEKRYNFDVQGIESFYDHVSSFLADDLERIIH